MKKNFSRLFLAVLLGAFCLTACGGTGEETPTPTTTPPAEDGGSANGSDTTATANATYTVNCAADTTDESAVISDLLYGLFLEDINHAVDGGMYAELIKNRSFEYGSAAANAKMHGWTKTNSDSVEFSVKDGLEDGNCLNENNPSYAVVTNTSSEYEGIANVGHLSGMAVTGNAAYNCSFYAKAPEGYSGSIRIAIKKPDGTVYAEGTVPAITSEWYKYEVTLTPSETVDSVRLSVEITAGTVNLDMVSLLPCETYKNTGVRKDIGEMLEALNPSFLRFPGGCVIEGKSPASMYNWKDSIGNGLTFTVNGEETTGDVATRPQGQSIWSGTATDPYYTTYGLGFYEYFVLCEALGCEAVPVLNAGMTCPVQSQNYIVYSLNSTEFRQFIQDALDLVEFCRGGADTYWGSVRIAMGHEEPFYLHYIGIGNEQWQSEYFTHYDAFVQAFESARSKNPELFEGIELIVANGPVSGDRYGWNYLEDYEDNITGLVDEHYYEAPSWFLSNTKRYDAYDRTTQAQVFLGEYAAQSNTLNAALAEAAYMTGIERNADIVRMACYAPLFGNNKVNQWTPDLIWYNQKTVYGSVNYYIQQMYANNVGTTILESSAEFAGGSAAEALNGKVGLGSWCTKVSYDNIVVTSNDTGEILYSNDFSDTASLKNDGWSINEGNWAITDGALVQSNTSDPADGNTGDAIYVGDTSWTNYTLTVDGVILGGAEGFLIPVCVENTSNNIFWNLGGWGNTVSCLQIVSGGSKSGQITGTVKNVRLEKNKTYNIKVVVQGNNINCYLNDTLYIDYTVEAAQLLYETASVDENGDIILKLVNATENALPTNVVLQNFNASDYESTATITQLKGNALTEQNSFSSPDLLVPADSTLEISENFTYEIPKLSVTILRIRHK